jgi:O-antigen/teichoic acid export membrane protein
MNSRKDMLRGGVDLTVGFALQQIAMLARNVVVARLVGPEQFGVAATLGVVVTALDAMTDIGVNRFLIRSHDGDDEHVVNSLHALVAFRGLVMGLLIAISAPVVAQLFGLPKYGDVTVAYMWLGLVPVIRGFTHLDVWRLHRQMSYKANMASQLSGSAGGLAVAILLAAMWHSYYAMLWSYIAEAALVSGVSHALAVRRYNFAVSREVMARVILYGWPLVLNGMLLFLVSRGDRLVIGSYLGIYELAQYSAVAIVTGGPALLLTKVLGSLGLPFLASVRTSDLDTSERYSVFAALTTVAAIFTTISLIAIGPEAIRALYGNGYNASPVVVGWLSIFAGAKILRSYPTTGALAQGRTRDILYSNIIWLIGFTAALLSIQAGYGASGLSICLALGECLSAAVISIRILPVQYRQYLLFIFIFTCTSIFMVEFKAASSSSRSVLLASIALGTFCIAVQLVIIAWINKPFRKLVLRLGSGSCYKNFIMTLRIYLWQS